MGLEIGTALYRSNGIDIANMANVANKILTNTQQQNQPTVQAIDYSKFNRVALGIDLYSSRTNVDLQKQIAIQQAGLYMQAIDVAKLNSQAAANLYSATTVQKNVELTQSIQQTELIAPRKLEQQSNIIELFNIADKNSKSSNSFNPFNQDNEEQKDA